MESNKVFFFVCSIVDHLPEINVKGLGGGFKYFFNVHPYFGKIPILANIFQMGWFNHQLKVILGMWKHHRRCEGSKTSNELENF